MADHETKDRAEELARQKLEGKSYSEIREGLRATGMGDEEISRLIREADERVLRETMNMGSRQKSQQWYRGGLVLAVAGLILSVMYNAGMIWSQAPAILVYTPFLSGILLMLYGRLTQRTKSDHSRSGPGPIRKKRPFK